MTKPYDEDNIYVDDFGRRLASDGHLVDEDNYYVDEQGNRIDPGSESSDVFALGRGAENDRTNADYGVYEEGQALPEGDPQRPDLSVLDWASLQHLNQAAVKDLDEGGTVLFWQAEGYVLIGDQHPSDQRALIEQSNGFRGGDGSSNPTGTLQMTRKGFFNDPGKLTVWGSPDSQAFALAVGEWSHKRVVFA